MIKRIGDVFIGVLLAVPIAALASGVVSSSDTPDHDGHVGNHDDHVGTHTTPEPVVATHGMEPSSVEMPAMQHETLEVRRDVHEDHHRSVHTGRSSRVPDRMVNDMHSRATGAHEDCGMMGAGGERAAMHAEHASHGRMHH